jgi:hypothetical protein
VTPDIAELDPIVISTLGCLREMSAMSCCTGFFVGNSLSDPPRRSCSSHLPILARSMRKLGQKPSLAIFQSRMTLWAEIFSTSAVSSTLSPPKNRSSMTFALRGSI